MNDLLMNLTPFLVLIGGLFAVVIAIILLFACWILLVRCRRMRYSPGADNALQRLIRELRSQISSQYQDVLEIEGIWAFDYPKVAVLFGSNHALEQATKNGYLDQLAIRVTHVVKSEPDFGRNRGSFDAKQAIWAMADRQIWDRNVKRIRLACHAK